MSSHREAPGISKDPVADNTDTYAFVSPDRSDTVTLIANYIPLEGPDGGPNFYSFGDDVLYSIYIDNDGDARPDITYEFRFKTKVRNPNTFLYNTGPIADLDSKNWNVRQFYSVTRIDGTGRHELDDDLSCPPVNVGIRSTPDYDALAKAAVHDLSGGTRIFAGQRREGFYVDLGSIFDLGALRPFQDLHLIPLAAHPGVDATKHLSVHTIALQIPKTLLTSDGSNPTDPTNPKSVIGVWAAASRRKVRVRIDDDVDEAGPWVQVSRLGNPLVNEVIIPLGKKDLWNSVAPSTDSQFQPYFAHPELAGLLPVLYPSPPAFPNLKAYTKERVDIEAIFLTGIPASILPTAPTFTGTTLAEMLRLNIAVAPATSPSINGVLGGDVAGFPNGRRVFDDVATIEIRALAGATIPLVDGTFTPDAAAGAVSDFSAAQFSSGSPPGADRYINNFPYLGVPESGFDVPS
jgi:hypothetical protein